MNKLVRLVNEWDAPTMLKIYKEYIDTNTCADTELPSIPEYVQKIDKYTYGFGWLLSEIDFKTSGFCRLSENREKPGDMFSAEIEIFVKPCYYRRGVGSCLYNMMFGIMEEGHKREVIARIALPNEPAVAFHKKWGFEEVRTEEGGFEKNGVKYDVLVMRKILNPVDPEAKKPVKPFVVKLEDSKRFFQLQGESEALIKEI